MKFAVRDVVEDIFVDEEIVWEQVRAEVCQITL